MCVCVKYFSWGMESFFLKSVVNASGPLMVRLDSNSDSISVVLSKKMIPLEVVSLFLSEKLI